jgi:hypothetical protein
MYVCMYVAEVVELESGDKTMAKTHFK